MKKAPVLVVEDNDPERQITAETLREEGFAVEEAPHGKRALELLKLGQLDAVLPEVIKVMRKVAPSSSTVLIEGESGTGKEIIASTLHKLSPRNARPFVAINCS